MTGRKKVRDLGKRRNRKPISEALQESEAKYRAIVENSPNMIGVLQDGVLKFVNRASTQRIGWTYEELLSPSFDPIEMVVAERFRELIRANIGRRLRGEDHPPYEISLTARDGSEIPVIARASKISYEGRPAIQFSFSETTDRHKYEGTLLALHTHASQLSSAGDIDTIVKCTLDAMAFALGFNHAYFLLVEGDSLQIRGGRGKSVAFSAQPLNGPGVTVKAAKTKRTILVPDTREEPAFVDPSGYDWKGARTVLSELVVPVLADGEAVAVLCVDSVRTNTFTNEDQRLLETLANHVGSALGRLVAHIASETKRVEHERQLESYSKRLEALVDERTKKLRQAETLAAIGETAAMVGHDLRNPLQGIAGASYNIRKNLGNTIDPSTKEMLAVIDGGVGYANGIINDLLEFSREVQLQRLPTTPRSIVRTALKDVQIPTTVIIVDETADDPEFLADESKLIRVLTNLIVNAIDAMPDGGKVSLSSLHSENEVSISVTDTGVGIPHDRMERIWRPLYTTKAKGIGLGLSICKRVVEGHGGSILVESTVGKGSTFTLKLPIGRVEGGER